MKFWKKKIDTPATEEPARSNSLFSTSVTGSLKKVQHAADVAMSAVDPAHARKDLSPLYAMDSCDAATSIKSQNAAPLSYALLAWYGSQSFIGHRACSLIAQHWLVDKACTMPARDAVRMGYEVKLEAEGLDEKQAAEIVAQIKRRDDDFRLNRHLVEFERLGRVYGIRIAMFKVTSTDPKYYENPYNPDGVTPGSYKGIVQIDPQWCTPELSFDGVSDPTSPEFYNPTYWTIGGKRIHRSHLIIMRTCEVPDDLKAMYRYGGIPVPQRIYERVYAAERTANEAPQLAMTKRLTTLKTDMTMATADWDRFQKNLLEWTQMRDNYGVKVLGLEESVEQSDTSLTDLDATIMTQYQLVAAASGVPVTKLLGTTPKGFNATGEYEEASYHEELESIQTHNLQPLIDRHHELLMRSEIQKKFSLGAPLPVSVIWAALDSPTATEFADINLKKAQTGAALVTSGALSPDEERARIINDPDSGYNGLSLEDMDVEPEPGDNEFAALQDLISTNA